MSYVLFNILKTAEITEKYVEHKYVSFLSIPSVPNVFT